MAIRRRPGLWVEIALALALITLSTILLNAGVFWLLLKHAEEERRTDLVLALSAALTAQLEVAYHEEGEPGVERVLAAYRGSGLEVDELYVAEPGMKTVASVAGEAPEVPDSGLRAAIFGREQYSELTGALWGKRWVVVTTPIAARGKTAALRVKMPLMAPAVPGGPAGFVLAYTIFSGFAIALFGFDLLRRRLIRPIDALRAGTDRIAGGEFGHLVTLDAARELTELSGALNTMSASLSAYRQRTTEQVEQLKSANAELGRAQAALVQSEKLAGVGRLAAGLAHEVGNPLAAVVGYVELLEAGLNDPALEKDLLARTRKELDRIHRIIQSLLGYARRPAQRAEAVAVRPAIEAAIAVARMRPDGRAVDFAALAEDGTPDAWIAPDHLQQVLLNLAVNAAQAVAGRPERRVTLWAAPDPAGVSVGCRDSGPGFSPVALERALEPFFTTKDVGEGTGMGLSVCQQLVEAAGGRISVGNHPEGGAVVAVTLPAAP